MGLESPSHWLIVAVVVLVLFGYKKLPEMSRSVGRSLRIFKTEMKGMSEDDSVREATAETPAPVPPVAATPPAIPPTPTLPGTPAVGLSKVAPVDAEAAGQAAAEAPRETPQQQAQG
jgi:sec-independent protein translocase protein TatA